MQVKNKEVFHIHRIGEWSDKWQVGARIDWTGEELNFFNRAGDDYDCVTEITNGKGTMDLFEALTLFSYRVRIRLWLSWIDSHDAHVCSTRASLSTAG